MNNAPNGTECFCCCKERSTYTGRVPIPVIRIKDFLRKVLEEWHRVLQCNLDLIYTK